MFYRRKIGIVGRVDTELVQQATEKQIIQLSTDITRTGTAYNIKIFNKEENSMIEKLNLYRAELEEKKAALLNEAIDVEEEVAAFRRELEEKKQAKKDADIAKVDSDIECIDGIIARINKEAEKAIVSDDVE